MEIKENYSLKKYNTFHLEVRTRFFLSIDDLNTVLDYLNEKEFHSIPRLILGGGSNILFTNDFPGITLKNNIRGFEIINENEDDVWIKIGAGENWHAFVIKAIDNGWGGLENLSLIPGTVGAAPMQNIGAYGVELEEVFEELEAINLKTGNVSKFNREECQFGYRSSIFKTTLKDQYIITSITLKLKKKNHQLNISYGALKSKLEEKKIKNPTIKDVSDAVIEIRKSKLPDPAEIGNAGSFFKNPVVSIIKYNSLLEEYDEVPGYKADRWSIKLSAAWLIDQCNWKGKTFNDIGVHKNHALVLVNYGKGKGREIKKLAEDIQHSVSEKFGIDLSPEVNFV